MTTSESTLSLVVDANNVDLFLLKNPSTLRFFALFEGILRVSPTLLQA